MVAAIATTTATATASKSVAADAWMYVDPATQQQRGPIPEAIAKRLIRKGILTPQQFVWTQRLTAWAPLASVEPFVDYCRVWFSYWYYMPDQSAVAASGEAVAQQGPLITSDLIALFLDGEIDGLTLVWAKDVTEWKPIGEVPLLKDFLREANEDQEREAEALERQERVDTDDQVFEEESVKAIVAEDGKEYVFDEETKKWVTPQQKIQDDLEALREAAEDGDDKQYKHKHVRTRAPPKAPPIPVSASTPSGPLPAAEPSGDQANSIEAEIMAALGEGVEKGATDVDAATTAANQEKKRKKKKKKSEKWKRAKTNTWVYVNGLPLDVTIQEVHDHFAKCGVIQTDLATETPRIKLYKNKDYGGLNGDGSVCYMKEASVELAVQLLDKSHIRPDWSIDVSPAVFEQKGVQFVKHKKQRLDSRAKVKRIEQEKALSWNEGEDGDRSGLRIVVIKHMFTPAEIQDATYEQELREDIDAECTKIGEVTKITLFPKHVDGVVVVKFASSGSAAQCVDIMNGRFFGGLKLVCHFWDGTDYTHRESTHEQAQRSEKFDEWLNEGSSSSEAEEEEEEDTEEGPEKQQPGEEAVHSGRVLPDLDEDSEDDEDGDEDDDGGAAVGGDEIHAGRVMPDLDDGVDSD